MPDLLLLALQSTIKLIQFTICKVSRMQIPDVAGDIELIKRAVTLDGFDIFFNLVYIGFMIKLCALKEAP